MLIDFENPVQPVDNCSQQAFVEILNLVLLADDVVQLRRLLHDRDKNERYNSLSGYYRWSFDNYSFTLWQRMEYGSRKCFTNKILEIKYISLICEDRRRPNIVKC